MGGELYFRIEGQDGVKERKKRGEEGKGVKEWVSRNV